MKKNPWRFCLILILSLGLMPAGCTKNSSSDSGEDRPEDIAVSVGPFDGTYTVSFISEGVQVALGTLIVTESKFAGDLISIFAETFWIEGYLDSDGTFIFEPIEGDLGSVVDAEGRIEEGLVSGNFDINGGDRDGIFCGSLGATPFELNPVTDFDATYQISLNYHSEEVGTTVFNIEEGKFSANITTIDDATFELTGFVTSDGTMVGSVVEGNEDIGFLAEGYIDHETLEIAGMYRIGPFAGQISGQASD